MTPSALASIESSVHTYFDAWNAHDPEAVTGCFAPDGTFEDPVTGAPVDPELLQLFVAGFSAAFPDGHLPIDHIDVIDERRAIVQFRTVGTNSGDSPLGPATNQAVDLPGVDVIAFADDGLISSVRGYWDMAAMHGQLGLQANLSPKSVEGLLDFGIGVRVHSGHTQEPGCFTVTSTDAAGPDADWVNSITEAIVTDLLAQPGYLGSCFTVAGGRHHTFTAWESPEAARGLRDTHHAEAMRAMLAGERCTRIMTSIWVPQKLNVTKAGPDGAKPAPVTEPEQWL